MTEGGARRRLVNGLAAASRRDSIFRGNVGDSIRRC